MKGIYAIYDNVAEAILGGLHIHAHDAPAIRMYGDVANLQNSQIGMHPQDFDLIKLGVLNDDNSITSLSSNGGKNVIVLTGANWAAAQQQQPETAPNAS